MGDGHDITKKFVVTVLPVMLVLLLAAGCGKDKEAPLLPDTTGPRVAITSPGDGDSNVALDASITVSFNENIDPLTITGSSFYITGGLTGTITYSSKSASLNPDSNFQYGTTYTVTVTTAVTDAAGNHMDSNYVWSFTTKFGDIMPLAIGYRWEFQVVNYTNPVVPDTAYDTIRVVGDTTIGNEVWYRAAIGRDAADHGEQWLFAGDTALIINRDDGLWRMTETGIPYLWLKFPGHVNDTYSADPTRGESVKITETSKFVSLPLLPFFYCYVYESAYTDPNTKDIFTSAPRTGPVIFAHYIGELIPSINERWTLIRYHLN